MRWYLERSSVFVLLSGSGVVGVGSFGGGDVMMVQFQVVVESFTSVFVHVGSAVVLSVAVLWSEDGICLEVAEVDVEWYERGE